jgi:hypothetical protein
MKLVHVLASGIAAALLCLGAAEGVGMSPSGGEGRDVTRGDHGWCC